MRTDVALRDRVKTQIERALGSRFARVLGLRRLRGAHLILCYHDVNADPQRVGTGDRSLHLSLDDFRTQLDSLLDSGVEISALGQTAGPEPRSPRVTITFDDACEGALQLAVPELEARSMPATMFVAPGILGLDAPWWDRLAEPATGRIPSAVRRLALEELHGRHDEILGCAAQRGWVVHAPPSGCRIGTESDIDAAMRTHDGLSLGVHTWGHPNLASLPDDQLRDELTAPFAWLRARWPDRVIPWIAYPYGLESARVRVAAATAGYRGGLLVSGGWHRRQTHPFAIPRLNVSSGITREGFRARLAGFLGA